MEDLYRENNINLPSSCSLSRLIADAKLVSDSWLVSASGRIPMPLVYNAAHLNRIADALLPLRGTSYCSRFLTEFRSGNLNLLLRDRCRVKSLLWELELSALLRMRSFDVSFVEPDIVTNFEDAKVGIACKKLYSDKHIQNILSEAAEQVESDVDFGIVALNLDDLAPQNSVLEARTLREAEDAVTNANNSFLARYDRHLRKYLASGRLLSALVSTAVVVQVPGEDIHVHNVRRCSIWAMRDLPAEKEQQLHEFYKRLML